MAGSVASMKTIVVPLLATLMDFLRSRASLQLEVLDLLQQLSVVFTTSTDAQLDSLFRRTAIPIVRRVPDDALPFVAGEN